VVSIIVAGRILPLERWLWEFSAWISHKGAEGFLLFTAGYAACTVLFVPGEILTMGAGFVFGVLRGTIAVSIGSTIGDTVAFLIARYLARENIRRLIGQNRKFAAMDAAIGEHGWKIVLLLRLSPLIPFNISNYLYGLTAIRFWPFVWSSFVGVLPGTVMFVYFGAVGRTGLLAIKGKEIPNTRLEIALLIAGLVMTCIATWYVHRVARRALRRPHH
jgi:uncharacterized membrane protein YdjX (TVP38/TMEM64 family)